MLSQLKNKANSVNNFSSLITQQKTISHPVSYRGIGVHSAKNVIISLFPAATDTGIVFERTDLKQDNIIKVTVSNVVDTFLSTKIANASGASVATIEHLMAAIAACEIDNLHIEIDGPEVPILDGSSIDFINLLESARIKEQKALRRVIRILKAITIKEEDRFAILEPAEEFSIHCTLDFQGRQGLIAETISFDSSSQSFREELSKARTFGFYEDAQKIFAAGLGLGASLDNTVVIDNGQVMNPEGLRYSNEFVRHKALDAFGDLYVIGHPLIGRYKAHNSGHTLNNKLVKALLSDKSAWRFESLGDSTEWHPAVYSLSNVHTISA
ncbi:MAG: UDP-3-O-[3-hydroxymyristoyl] N-acetylglucosamine deacetylase [Holosporales bacterium]|nr:UDP-3-O-[3-hydroxymyristoyl] N-acetylglucosamine deacetylase [Holosporales bacterium]